LSQRDDISRLIEKYADFNPDRLHDASLGLPLAVPSFGAAEIGEAISALLSGWVTMGKRVSAFEDAWASQVGTTEAIAVNSGSSALLVMLTALIAEGHLRRGDEVLVPAVGWSTSLFSVVQAGLTAVIVDIDPDSLCIEGKRDRPALALHMLGCPSRVTAPLIIEDACGAHGAMVGNKPVGSLGIAAAFSFFFSHHITTGEGGAVTTSDPALADAARSIRAHGWTRERSDAAAQAAARPDIDPRFLFVTPGYNLRMTDLAGAFGMHQVGRLDDFVARRRANHIDWCARIDALGLPLRTFPELPGTRHAAFAFPLLLSEDCPLTRAQLCAHLEAAGISTRPISGSNLTRQPAFKRLVGVRVEGELPVADAVHERGLFVGQSHAFGADHGTLLARTLLSAF
jgi:CDP-4-dehydro-6-deoxyglucose reductase, E1